MTLAELLERVEKATMPDRELDAEIFCSIDQQTQDCPVHVGIPGRPLRAQPDSDRPGFAKARNNVAGVGWSIEVVPYTESVDAALALVERVLPGWQIYLEILREANGGCGARVAPNQDARRCLGATPPLAILAAMLRALAAKSA